MQVPIFNAAKTVADCFKFRNKIGLDVALEALRDAWSQKKLTMDDLWHYANIDRVANAMRPYIESIAGCHPGTQRLFLPDRLWPLALQS